MKTLVLPYKAGSKSASAIAKALGLSKLNVNNTDVRSGVRNLLNWGNTGNSFPVASLGDTRTIWNHPDEVAVASNKLSCLERLSGAGVTVPEFTTDMAVASRWLEDDKEVVERHILNGSSGRGIQVVNSVDQLQQCPLYTLYVKKKEEYRIHIIDGVVVDVQRKARKLEVHSSEVNWKVRNLEGGFIFARQNIDTPLDVIGQALSAYDAMSLSFCAIDVIYNEKQKRAYVLEINTAPGLEGTTLETYTTGLQRLINNEAQVAFDVSTAETEDIPEPNEPAPLPRPSPSRPSSGTVDQQRAMPMNWFLQDSVPVHDRATTAERLQLARRLRDEGLQDFSLDSDD